MPQVGPKLVPIPPPAPLVFSPNSAPVYSRLGAIAVGQTLLTANTAKDGTGTVVVAFTADAVNGGRCERLRFQPLGSTGGPTVARVFINNGQANSNALNNTYFKDISLPQATLSETASMPFTDLLLNGDEGLHLPAGYRLLVTIGTTVTAGFAVTAPGGAY